MIFTVLSCFDNRVGPRVFLKAPEISNPVQLEHVSLLMDLYKEGFFVHEIGDLKTANYIFEIYSPRARGRREILMVSIVSYQEEFNIDLHSFQEILEYFAFQLNSIEDIYQGFHYEEMPDWNNKYTDIIDFVYTFHNSLPSERAIYNQLFSQVLTFKLSPQGRTTILNDLQQKLYTTSNTTNIGNMSEKFKI